MNQFDNFMKPFCHIAEVPVTFFNSKVDIQWECLSNKKICCFFRNNNEQQNICRRSMLSSTIMAAQLGEPYIFLCPCGLVNIAVSLIFNGDVQGSFIAGPIAMGNNKESTIKNIMKNVPVSPDIYPNLTIFLSNIKIFSPKDVAYLATLFNSTILSSISVNEEYKKINEKHKEQASLGERIQKNKKNNRQLDYPQQLEDELINRVKNGDTKGANKTVMSLLNEISLIESGNLSFIKIRVLGICAILSRITSKYDSSFQISSQEIENMDILNKVESFKELCLLTSKIVNSLTANISLKRYSGSSSIVKQATQFINENYMNKISLKTVAVVLHSNQSYLSTLFKREMGTSFTEYLIDIRIKKSQDLLSSTNLSLVDIALCAGFEGQSYFTKIFKKKNGITPSQYRKINQNISL